MDSDMNIDMDSDTDTNLDTDVIVVGAGPTGLLLAAELALAGVAVEVLDRLLAPDPTVKAGSISVATAEIFDRRGLLPAVRDVHRATLERVTAFARSRAGSGASPTPSTRLGNATGTPTFPVAGHFAGMFFRPDLVDHDDELLRRHTQVGDAVLVPQADLEALLTRHAVELGVHIRRGVDVTDIHQDDSAVTLQTSEGELRAGWVVAADGGRSAIRKSLGIDFVGTDAEITGYQAIAELEGADALSPGWTWTPTGVYSYGPIPGRILTVQFTGAPADRSAPVTAAEVQDSIRLVSGTDVAVTAMHGTATRWTDNARQATTYRAGRVLLAGDAAHVHSPFSGQGLNLGVGDASNLGWKLAATVNGWAPAGLLDTYQAERHPIGAWVLDWTRAQVALMRGDVKTGQLRTVVQQQLMGTPAAMTRLVALTSGVAQDYAPRPGDAAVNVDRGVGHAGLVGRLVGDVALADGSRLAEYAHPGRFVLLDRSAGAGCTEIASAWSDRLEIVTDTAAGAARDASDDAAGSDGFTGLIVRPDGVIVWVGVDVSGEGLEDALRAWAGDQD